MVQEARFDEIGRSARSHVTRIVEFVINSRRVANMTDAEELESLDVWLIDIGQSMRELSAAVQQFYEKLSRKPELTDEDLSRHAAGDLREAGTAPFNPAPLLLWSSRYSSLSPGDRAT